MKKRLLLLVLSLPIGILAQKKVLDHSDLALWNTIEEETISPNGNFIAYALEKGERDNYLKVKNTKGGILFEHERAEKGRFTYDSQFVLFTIKAWKDSVRALKSRKTKKKDLPKDTLGIFNLDNGKLSKIGAVKTYKTPEKWSGYVAYQLHVPKSSSKNQADTLQKKKARKTKEKKPNKKNGYHLVIRNLHSQKEDTVRFVTDYLFAKKGKRLVYVATGSDEDSETGVFVKDLETNDTWNVHSSIKGKYPQLSFSESGKNLGFVVDTDTTKSQIRPNELFLWQEGQQTAKSVLDTSSSPQGYRVSAYGELHFSKNETKLFFGLSKPPVLKDTTLTEEEIVNVEVWTYNEPRLYTVQELELKNDTIQSYKALFDLKKEKVIQLGDSIFINTELSDKGNGRYALVNTPRPHELESQWTGRRDFAYRVIDTETGATHFEIDKMPQMSLSPKGKYAYGYSRVDSTWFTYNLGTKKLNELTKGKVFYNELNDIPNHPYPYGVVGWTENDEHLVLYDRYDIWKFDPDTGTSYKLTAGREKNTSYRYISVDDELHHLPLNTKWLLHAFNEDTKAGGYAAFNPANNRTKELVSGPFRYGTPKKAALSNKLIFTKESFQEFPNLWGTTLEFKKLVQLSDANPQQKEYRWGTIELVRWTSLDGKELTGMLVKPEDFDPTKKYPLLVNFYERSSNRLHRHHTPKAERSSLNYSFYASRGYVIFNPDVHYRIGYPGESAYNCVIPGITSLIEQGFIDKENIGVQGHSWGGYQIAYLVTKTNIFKAAESGAPVPNMISAYGGIRWWTGLSRQFQYEHTQSRIGGTPWEYPQRYIENSPIFNIDKINTPLLIMHNDADGHVPWYQGIEFFVSLRRLGKPSWFLNYNGEPHWPLKLQNRQDFNKRMAQFFDHYLKAAPKPRWMQRGVPAMEKGILQGYESVKERTNGTGQ